MAKCYKMAISAFIRAQIEPILQAPDGLQNPRETKAFAIGYEAGKWSITSVQKGNNFAHTLPCVLLETLRVGLPSHGSAVDRRAKLTPFEG